MSEKKVVVVVSDLHMGGGKDDPGDDHVYDENQFANFLQYFLPGKPEGNGDIELFINGDFLEFAQSSQSTYGIMSRDAWCSEEESLAKLNSIIKGHRPVFDAIKEFQKLGNKVTIAAGNHDVDLYWPSVKDRIKEVAGNVDIVVSEEWCSRFNGGLRIAHGHQFDPANRFENWSAPIAKESPDGVNRLEMCPGTFFMVRFLNKLENKYPFADNIKPFWALIGILLRERPFGSLPFLWMILRHLAVEQSLEGTLNIDAFDDKKMSDWLDDFPKHFVSEMRTNAEFAKTVTDWYHKYIDENAKMHAIEYKLQDKSNLEKFLTKIATEEDATLWDQTMGHLTDAAQTLGAEEGTLGLGRSLVTDEKKKFGRRAQEQMQNSGAQVVVMGHTHEPDKQTFVEGVYLNPGSWTRYANKNDFSDFTMESLADESIYPYELKYIWVEEDGDKLRASLETYAEFSPGK